MVKEDIFSSRTKGVPDTKDKPRVFFTCHPDDFYYYFEKICEDLFKTHDCVIYYTKDMSKDLNSQDNIVCLERINLFVVPVTFRLLQEKNRTMDFDLKFALQKRIPVLPIVVERGIDELYSRSDKFGELQYIDSCAQDITAISYEDKLKKYLDSVLINTKMAQRIREAFDAYIFLSYRKKDRAYANELMKLIHKDPQCRDIAIWFDEFLTPGESFKDNIDKMLTNSDLFALLVTPNLIEMPNGKPNFIMTTEYPTAKERGKNIIPTEMKTTDKDLLKSLFEGIPDCVSVKDESEFRLRFLDAIKRAAISSNDNNPEHSYLIGLAYLEGIDVEVDIEKGVSLITEAGEAGCIEAMSKLFNMYLIGDKVSLDYNKSLYWARKRVDYLSKNCKNAVKEILESKKDLAISYYWLDKFTEALRVEEEIFDRLSEYNDIFAGEIMCQIGELKVRCGCNTVMSLELLEKAYEIFKSNKDISGMLKTLERIAIIYFQTGNRHKAAKILKKCYNIYKEYDKNGNGANSVLHHLAYINTSRVTTIIKSLKQHKECYRLYLEKYGENHPITLMEKYSIVYVKYKIGKRRTCLEDLNEIHAKMIEAVGSNYPKVLEIERNIACLYSMKLGDHKEGLRRLEKCFNTSKNIYGKTHPFTLSTQNCLAVMYGKCGNWSKAKELNERLYKIKQKAQNEDNSETLKILRELVVICFKLGNWESATKYLKKTVLIKKNLSHKRKIIAQKKMPLFEDLEQPTL